MWVVKLGGSLFDAKELPAWLERLTALPVPVVLVPGGGPFADQVRAAQARWAFDDTSAHAMALLGMTQMGMMLCGLHACLSLARTPAAIAARQRAGRVPVWSPGRMVLAEPGIAQDWDVTSDSLALWLADRLDADAVVLVKSAALDGHLTDGAMLQREGLVDAAFDRFANTLTCPVYLLNKADPAALGELVLGRSATAMRLAG